MKYNTVIQWAALFFIVIGALSLVSASSGVIKLPDALSQKPEIQCEAQIGGLIVGQAKLNSATCLKTGKMCSNLFSSSPLSILRVQGKLQFDAGDSIRTESFDVSRFTGSKVIKTAPLCTHSTTINVKLINDEGNLVDSKTVTVP